MVHTSAVKYTDAEKNIYVRLQQRKGFHKF
jgi:hypothetical protein